MVKRNQSIFKGMGCTKVYLNILIFKCFNAEMSVTGVFQRYKVRNCKAKVVDFSDEMSVTRV